MNIILLVLLRKINKMTTHSLFYDPVSKDPADRFAGAA
jgi:hypothetical protein